MKEIAAFLDETLRPEVTMFGLSAGNPGAAGRDQAKVDSATEKLHKTMVA